MFYFAHAGHEHPTEVDNHGLLIVLVIIGVLLLITVVGIYFKLNANKIISQKNQKKK